MKNTHNEELYIRQNNLSDKLFDKSSIFFDIETTGFSPASSFTYMIGCAYRKDKNICIDQFFAEAPAEESLILKEFIKLLKNYKTMISFNGIGFDIPFLKARFSKYDIDEDFSSYNFIDIFKSITPLKPLLKLENYKQKTLEKFLQINRDDTYSGGDLINIYSEYIKNPDPGSLSCLMLHNYEDVLGMTELLPILSYLKLADRKYTIVDSRLSDYKTYDGKNEEEFFITLANDYVVPKPVSIRDDSFCLSISKEKTVIRTKVINDSLKYFYTDYKNYYYLPKEDMAIHKSVAAYVDRDHKEKCKASNCYIKKEGKFIIQHENIMQPLFKNDIKDKYSFFQLTSDFCSSNEMLLRYADHVIRHFIHIK